MYMKNNIIDCDYAVNNIIACLHCNSFNLWRVPRTEAEKITCYLSGGKCAIRKYLCHSCRKTTLLNRNDVQIPDSFKITQDRIDGILSCPQCNSQKFEIVKPANLPDGKNFTGIGSTVFCKVLCLQCRYEISITNREFELFNAQEF
jgi:hypothetical protein